MASVISKPQPQSPVGTGTQRPAVSGGSVMMAVPAVKDQVRDAIYAQRDPLVRLAHEIHDHPELAFAEEYAASRISEFLAEEGFAIRKGICGMPTAFVATIGHGALHVAFCAEYDALPPTSLWTGLKPSEVTKLWQTPEEQDAPLQHACGHDLIAGAAVTAATGLKDLADEVGLTVSVFGTPAEELIGLKDPPAGDLAPGKVKLLEGGAFEGVHAALMIHPGPTPYNMIVPSKAGLRFQARFSRAGTGRSSFGPAEARQLEQALRRSLLPLHQAPYFCVVQPERQNAGARADIFYAGRSLAQVMDLREAVRRCFEAAASSVGVKVQVTEYLPSDEMRHDPLLSASYRQNWQALGRVRERDEDIQEEFCKIIPFGPRILKPLLGRLIAPGLFLDKLPINFLWGTDLANVSQVIPAIHPFLGIGGTASPHTVKFAAQGGTELARQAMLDSGVALAWTALDVATEPTLRAHLLERASSRNASSPRIAGATVKRPVSEVTRLMDERSSI